METVEQNAKPRTFVRDVLVLGIGNILWADEGFGPRAAEAFHQTYRPLKGVDVMDGGTLGNYLINEITTSRRILVFDCCDFHEAPGYMRVLRGDEVGVWSATKISPHQTGMNDLLAVAQLQGNLPEEIVVIGIQPDELNDYGGSLTKKIRVQVPEAVALAAEELARWGIALEKRPAGEKVESLSTDSLGLNVYESERPSEKEACRTGDVRFFPQGGR